MSDTTLENCEPICTNPSLQSPLNVSSKDKFILILNLPKILRETLKQESKRYLEKLQLTVSGTVVPDITVTPIDVRYGGQTVKYSAYNRPEYGPFVTTFTVDNNYDNYYVLWKWLSILNDPRQSYYAGTTSSPQSNETEYQTTFSLLALNEYNVPIVEFKYYNAFVKSLGAIQYNYKEENNIIESTVEFQFSQLEMFQIKNNV